MSKNSIRPRFVDLFFAVVIGTSFSLIKLDNSLIDILSKLFLILVIIEDWYGYYIHVVPVDSKQKKYNILSLIIEFAILTTWYFTISSKSDEIFLYTLFFSIYFFLRFIGGLIMFLRKMIEVKFLYKGLSLFVPIILVWCAYYYSTSGYFQNYFVYILSFVGWLIHLVIYWFFKKK